MFRPENEATRRAGEADRYLRRAAAELRLTEFAARNDQALLPESQTRFYRNLRTASVWLAQTPPLPGQPDAFAAGEAAWRQLDATNRLLAQELQFEDVRRQAELLGPKGSGAATRPLQRSPGTATFADEMPLEGGTLSAWQSEGGVPHLLLVPVQESFAHRWLSTLSFWGLCACLLALIAWRKPASV